LVPDDHELLERGVAIFDGLHTVVKETASPHGARAGADDHDSMATRRPAQDALWPTAGP
jgi:hypothetical protein